MREMIPFLLLGIAFATTTAHADYPELRGRDPARQEALKPRLDKIRTAHPRIFLSAEEIPALRERIDATPELREVYSWLMEWVEGNYFYENLWATGSQAIAASIAYRLSDDPAARDLAIRIADYLAEAEGDSWTWPRVAKGLAFVYDWLYDDLSDEQKERYGRAAIRAAKECYKTWRHSEFNNHLYLEYGPVLYVGIALRGEGIDDAAAETFALDGLDLLVNFMMPAHEIVSQGDGGWYESMSYHAFFTYEFAYLVELWQSASGEDLWSDFNGLDNEGAFQLYNTRPFDLGWVGLADIGKRDAMSEVNANYLALTSRRRRDGVARYWADFVKEASKRRHAEGRRYVRNGSSWWAYLLWYDPTVPKVGPEDLPPARIFRGLGWVSMRSDWTREATFAHFVAAPIWIGGHQHADANSFIIHKNGLLALDSGVYDASTPHRANYYARSIAHNTITVYDPSEQFPGGTWGSGKMGQGSNDGGQMLGPGLSRVADYRPEDDFHRAKIVAYEHTPEFTYVVGDATRAYSPKKLREFQRAFLFVPPDLFVVFDRVESTNAAFTKRWLLHSATEPVFEEDGPATISNGRSLLEVRTLLPRRVERRKIGGPGHEFEVEGRNYPPGKQYDPDEAGRWRIEIEPKEAATRDDFLHLLRVVDVGSDGNVLAEAIDARVEDGRERVTVVIETKRRTIDVTFRKDGPLAGSIRIVDGEGNELVPRRPLPTEVRVAR